MPQLSITKNYQDNATLTQAELDAAFSSVETFINTTKLDGDNLQAAIIDQNHLANNSVGTAQILDANVTTAKILDANITTAKIATANVTAAKLVTRTVSSTAAALEGILVTASCGAFSTTNHVSTDAVTNLSGSITVSGNNPVMVTLAPDGSTTTSYIEIQRTTDTTGGATASIVLSVDGGTAQYLGVTGGFVNASAREGYFSSPGTYSICLTGLSAGSHTLAVRAGVAGTAQELDITNCVLVAYELK